MSGFERKSHQRGFSLLEVLVAIVIFAIGLLAIASLQGDLMRGGNVAKSRTVASSLAEQQLEELRSFLEGDDYGAIIPGTETIEESGVMFERETDIQDYHYSGPGSDLVAGADGEGNVDVKLATVSVSWCDADSGPECDPSNPDTTDAHSIMIQDFVGRSASAVGSARALSHMLAGAPPRVPYDPGETPETISIDLELDDNTRKESPQPALKTTRGGSEDSEAEGVNTVTRLESITYNTPNTETQTVQRQEFFAANCTCAFGPDSTDDIPDDQEIGHTPVFWDGDNWVGRVAVEDKQVGHFPGGSNLGPQLTAICSTCCRDHHDGGSDTTFEYTDQGGNVREVDVAKYNPFQHQYNASGNHLHYDGTLSEPVTSGEYLEACRFARMDGRMVLATDFQLESLEVLPGTTDPASDPQPFESWIVNYRNFVTDFVESFATAAESSSDYPSITPSADNDDSIPTAADYNLPTTDDTPGSETRQLVARAIYVDYLHPVLQNRIACRLGGGTNCLEAETNDDGTLKPLLPILPFYEVNVALQANWAEVLDNLVEVTDEPVADAQAYSRGEVTLNDGTAGDARVVASIEQGNIGLTDTHDITPFDCRDDGRLIIDGLLYDGPGSAGDPISSSGCLEIEAALIENDVIAPSDITIEDPFANDCGTSLGDNFYECRIRMNDGTDNIITVSNYSTNQTNVKVCLRFTDADGNEAFEGADVFNDGTKSELAEFNLGSQSASLDLDMIFVVQGGSNDKNCPKGQLQ